MTLKQLQALRDDILDEKGALAMGWLKGPAHRYETNDDRWLVNCPTEYWQEETHWNPSGNLNQAAELEAEIARRGLGHKHSKILIEMIEKSPSEFGAIFDLIYASARTRTVAAVFVLQGQ